MRVKLTAVNLFENSDFRYWATTTDDSGYVLNYRYPTGLYVAGDSDRRVELYGKTYLKLDDETAIVRTRWGDDFTPLNDNQNYVISFRYKTVAGSLAVVVNGNTEATVTGTGYKVHTSSGETAITVEFEGTGECYITDLSISVELTTELGKVIDRAVPTNSRDMSGFLGCNSQQEDTNRKAVTIPGILCEEEAEKLRNFLEVATAYNTYVKIEDLTTTPTGYGSEKWGTSTWGGGTESSTYTLYGVVTGYTETDRDGFYYFSISFEADRGGYIIE